MMVRRRSKGGGCLNCLVESCVVWFVSVDGWIIGTRVCGGTRRGSLVCCKMHGVRCILLEV